MNNCYLEGQNLFALVSYTPEPLLSWLTNLRLLLAVQASSPPHITILPPRPLLLPTEEAVQKLTAILAPWNRFTVELAGIRVFAGSNVLYFEVGEGGSTLHGLHAQLNAGEFAHEETFEFHPHVTIGMPLSAQDLEAISAKAIEAWETSLCPCQFELAEVVFVSMEANGSRGDWRRLWVHKLGDGNTHRQPAQAAATSRTS